MKEEKYSPYSNCCGRPLPKADPQCNWSCGPTSECCGCTVGRIKKDVDPCKSCATIPSVTVDSIDGITNLANCLVHVNDINTTFYIDDKHRIMITWAGPVDIPGYDMAGNPEGFRDQIVTDVEAEVAVIYDKNGVGYTFGVKQGADVTDAVNMKLDEMAQDGTLAEVVGQYLDAKILYTFDTVADMKASTDLVDGSYARTLGFHSLNDGGGATYKITDSGTANEMDVISVGALYASLVKLGIVNVKQYGAYGDGTKNDSPYIQRAISSSYHSTIYIPFGSYSICEPINITSSVNIIGDGFYSNLVKSDISSYDVTIDYNDTSFDFGDYPSIFNCIFPTDSNLNYLNIKGLSLSRSPSVSDSTYGIIAPHLAYSTIENCRFTNCSYSILLGGWNDVVKKCEFFKGSTAIESKTGLNYNNITVTECYAKECYFSIKNSHGSIISNTHIDSVGTPFVFVNCPNITLQSCSTEVWAKEINANNSFVNVQGCDFELHNKERYVCFIEASNSATINIYDTYFHYEDYADPGEYPSGYFVMNSGDSKIYINNSKISVPFAITDYLSGNGLNKINEYINSNVFAEKSVIKKNITIEAIKTEIARFSWAYGKCLQFKINGYGQHQYATVAIDTNIAALNRGADSRIITVDDDTIVASNNVGWTASITAEYEADNTLVIYYNQTNSWDLTIEVEIEYNKATV